MRKPFYKYLSNLFKENSKVVILLGDIGVFSFQGCFAYDKNRIFNMGIMEQTMIGVSSALSSSGFIPFVHSIAPFVSERCYEQLKLNLGYENKNVFIVSVGNSYDYAALGSTHHCPNDLSIVSVIPNFKTFCPGNSFDVEKIISGNLSTECPKYIRLSEQENNLGRACEDLEILRSSNNAVVIIVGNAVKDMKRLLDSGLNATVLYTYNISEFDIKKFNEILQSLNIRRNIIVVEPSADSGIISKISLGIKDISSISSIAFPRVFVDKYGSKKELDKYLQLDDESIIERIKKNL